jgi:hypothetical protein
MQLNRKKLLSILLVILISLLACRTTSSNENEGTNGANTNSQENDNGPSESISVFEPVGPEELNLEDPSLFMDSNEINYYLDFIYSFEGEDNNGNEVFGYIQLEGKNAITPEIASDYEMNIVGLAATDGIAYLHFVDTPSRDYVFIPESGCLSFGNDEFESPYGAFGESNEMLIGTAHRVETAVMVNGVLTDRYELSNDNMDASIMDPGDTFELDEGSIWIAREGYLIKLEMVGTGTSVSLTGDSSLVGDIVYEFKFSPTNAPLPINPPAECDTDNAGNPESSFPMTDDADNITSMADDFISYTTSYSLEELLSFFTQEMAMDGYTLDTEMVIGTLITLRFVKGNESINIIALSEDGGDFNVTIVKEN